ncbi:hypothetical protein GCM10009850_006510 [Nonomuraea monospora]|uniref:Uncharacterized protein n=1 Tax=Nonomuraea monospora TaxID=568818 RepID=A0ABN3C6V5_9ACTN
MSAVLSPRYTHRCCRVRECCVLVRRLNVLTVTSATPPAATRLRGGNAGLGAGLRWRPAL